LDNGAVAFGSHLFRGELSLIDAFETANNELARIEELGGQAFTDTELLFVVGGVNAEPGFCRPVPHAIRAKLVQ